MEAEWDLGRSRLETWCVSFEMFHKYRYPSWSWMGFICYEDFLYSMTAGAGIDSSFCGYWRHFWYSRLRRLKALVVRLCSIVFCLYKSKRYSLSKFWRQVSTSIPSTHNSYSSPHSCSEHPYCLIRNHARSLLQCFGIRHAKKVQRLAEG
jgi:hypothetical protein